MHLAPLFTGFAPLKSSLHGGVLPPPPPPPLPARHCSCLQADMIFNFFPHISDSSQKFFMIASETNSISIIACPSLEWYSQHLETRTFSINQYNPNVTEFEHFHENFLVTVPLVARKFECIQNTSQQTLLGSKLRRV